MASITGYARDLEREADAEGYRRMVAAGYEPSEAPRLFRILDGWLAETGVKDPYFFSSHPKVRERIDGFRVVLRLRLKNGEEKRYSLYGGMSGDWVFEIYYAAPTRHYFGRDLETFEGVVRSFRVLAPS